MIRLRLLAIAGAAALTLAAGRTASAQSATINVSAQVQTPLTLTVNSPLAFTTVFPGVAKTVTATGGANSATAGNVGIAGQGNAQVNISFVLPTTLATGGGTTMPISFSATSGCYNTTNAATGCTTFNPAAAIQQNLSATGALYVFLGGTVTPATTQAAGTYNGTVTINVAYTGN